MRSFLAFGHLALFFAACASSTGLDSSVADTSTATDGATADSASPDTSVATDGAADGGSMDTGPAASCTDGMMNGDESDVDCGGSCEPCAAGSPCGSGTDCVSRVCGADGLCAAPACDDLIRNGDESDVDCGGSCEPCEECRGCTADAHCAQGRCVSGRCELSVELYVDWLTHCSTDGSARVTEDLPAGRYRLTALDSGGTVWSSVSLPTRGWYYRIECENLSAPMVATPSGVYYANAATAFANLMSTTEDVDFEGGTLVCRKLDSACTDNSGGVRFRLERLCM